MQINCESMPVGPDNPYGVGFVALETVLETEKQAQRDIDPYKSRCWKVVNYNSHNRVTGVLVAPPASALPAHPGLRYPCQVLVLASPLQALGGSTSALLEHWVSRGFNLEKPRSVSSSSFSFFFFFFFWGGDSEIVQKPLSVIASDHVL